MDTWILYIIKGILRILIAVSAGTALGSIFEARNWLQYISSASKPLLKFGRLPSVCGTAFLTAIFSNSAAAAMLAGARTENKISRREMIASGIINSFPAHFSHLIRVMFFLIPLLGMVAVYYCIIQFFLNLIRTLLVLFFIRFSNKSQRYDYSLIEKKQPLPWKQTFVKTRKRVVKIIKRVLIISIPLYIIVSYLGYIGIFKSIDKIMPGFLQTILSPEIISIVAAKLGGLTASASVALGMMQVSEITVIQVLFAFFVGNLIDIPIRTLRRNLPIALGIYPGKDGFWIVLISSSLRIVFTIITILILGVIILSQ